MSHTTTLPIAPPPPTPPNVLRCANNTSTNTVKTNHQKPQLEECLWALDHPDLQKACFLARICTIKRPKSCSYYNIASILQVGPTCGLTAVSMMLGIPPYTLLQEAQQRQFTYNGEMFSAFNLYQLICDYLPVFNNNGGSGEGCIDDQQCKGNANGTTDNKCTNHRICATHHKTIECQMFEGRLNCAKVKEALRNGACIFVPYPFQSNRISIYL